jgi:DNA polymerase-3 subunit delta'
MILGHEKQIKLLKEILNSGKVPHAFLFCGKEKLGKRKIAFEFASWILNSQAQTHPDFFYVEPIKNQISIEQIRDLIWKIFLKPFRSRYKVAIIDSANRMTLEAQNCFLKTLEEPKGNSVIILIAESENLLLPTIVSRCQKIKFFPVEKEKIESFLREKGVEETKIKRILRFAQGRPGMAIELLENEKKLEEFEKIEKDLIKIKNGEISFKFQKAKEFIENLDIFEILEVLSIHFKEKILEEKSKEILEEIQKIYFLTKTSNVDKRLALEILFLKL